MRYQDIAEKVGKRIREARLKSGLTQKELGARVNRSDGYIGEAENANNDITLRTLAGIAAATGIALESLITGKPESDDELDGFARLRIYNLEDRLAVASILIKNGYTVGQTKARRTETGKQVDYYLAVKLVGGNADTSR